MADIDTRAAGLDQEQEAPAVAEAASHADLWLGRQVRALRQGMRLSLKDLADQAGISIGMLSQVERGISSPSIKTLRQIAEALAVPVMYFFRGAEHGDIREIDRIVRAKGRRILRLPTNGVTKELLTPDLSGELEVLLVVMTPGGTSGPAPYTHKGEEAGYVLTGSLRLFVADDMYLLHAGDSFRFASTIPHRFENASAEETQVIWVMTPPMY